MLARARRLLIPLALGVFSLNAFVLTSILPIPAVANATSRPNVAIIMTDDQRWDTVTPQYMPNLTHILSQNPSITYTNSFVPNSLCCPSRTSTLTGDYSHTTGVYGNTAQFGGWEAFTHSPVGRSISTVNDRTTIAVDMHQAGYRTALVGKYLNGYPAAGNYRYVPPGWDHWFAVHTGSYYNYPVATGGKIVRHGDGPKSYITRVLANRAVKFIQASSDPFFLYYAPTAPHGPSIPDPRDVGRFSLDGYARPPSEGVAGAGAGAPNYISQRSWSAQDQAGVDGFHRLQLDSIYGVDRSIGKLWSVLPDNTIVLFMSDNGYEWGQHMWNGKLVPFNEAIRIPMSIVGKNLTVPLTGTGQDGRLVLNVDVAPTLEGYAGVATRHIFEGESMFTSARPDFVLEHWDAQDNTVYGAVPTYCGVRTADWMYVKYNGSEEPVNKGLYDENADPYEMNNLAVTNPNDPTVAAKLTQMKSEASTLCTRGTIYPSDWPFHGA
jgi:N-acetylglucosamine-6-sulfatase